MKLQTSFLLFASALVFSSTKAEHECKTFQNGVAKDDGTTTLQSWCDSQHTKCCQGPGACENWSPNAEYEVCEGACNGVWSCRGIATYAPATATVSLKNGSCTSPVTACTNMAQTATSLKSLTIGVDACTSDSLSPCNGFAYAAKDLDTMEVGNYSCSGSRACSLAMYDSETLTEINIPASECVSDMSCTLCKSHTTQVHLTPLTQSTCSL